MSAALKNETIFAELINKVADIVSKLSGNVLEDKQRSMLETRIKKRMIDLKISTPEEYISFIDKNMASESEKLVSLMTTHHTFFFREFMHFEYIREHLPEICASVKKRGDNKIRIWSSACSRGQEVYSLAMFLKHYLPQVDPKMSYEIIGTDIDPESVAIAVNGVYLRQEIIKAPAKLIGDFWARGKGDISHYVKAKNDLREGLSFKVANLLDFKSAMNGSKFDFIFCRNCFIYFKPEQVRNITKNFFDHLHPQGKIISGISESLVNLGVDLHTLGPSIYMKKSDIIVEESSVAEKGQSAPIAPVAKTAWSMPETLKVLCVDDSKSILTILSKVLSKEHGFEVVGKAMNGLEAQEFVKNNKVDLLTLDLHMPEMDGVEYLKKNFGKDHPPVVVVSSASRDDSSFAMDSLRNGASDFVEKPSLNNLADRADEIRSKLKMAYMEKNSTPAITSIDKEFSEDIKIKNPDDCLMIVVGSYLTKEKMIKFANELKGTKAPCLFLTEGQDNLLKGFKEELDKDIRGTVHLLDEVPESVSPDNFYLGDIKKNFSDLRDKFGKRKTSIMVLGKSSEKTEELLLSWDSPQLLLEDLGEVNSSLREVASDIFPWTSFAYVATKYLSDES